MSIEKRLLREAAIEAKKDKIKKIWQQYKKLIISAAVATILLIIIMISYDIHRKTKQEKYSTLLQQVFINQQEGNLDLAQEGLRNLYEDPSTPDDIKSLASLKYAGLLFQNNQINQAVNIYLEINKNNNYDPFIKELAGLNALKSLIDSNDNLYKQKIIDLSALLETNSVLLKYYIIEQKAIFEWNQHNFKIANDIFQGLIDNPEVSPEIKKRALQMNKIYSSKYDK